MNIKELAHEVQYDVDGLTLKQIEEVINSVFDNISECLIDEELVRIKNFGVFETITIAGRMNTNPLDPHGEKIYLPPFKNIKFRPFISLKDRVKGGEQVD